MQEIARGVLANFHLLRLGETLLVSIYAKPFPGLEAIVSLPATRYIKVLT